MVEPKVYTKAVILSEEWRQQFFNGSPAPLEKALRPISTLTPDFSDLYETIKNKADYGDVQVQRIATNVSLGREHS